MFAATARLVASVRRPSPANSTSVAVAVPVKMPAEKPESTRASKIAANPCAFKNAAALSAESIKPESKMRLRPMRSERWPKSSKPATTPNAYVAKITVTSSGANPNSR